MSSEGNLTMLGLIANLDPFIKGFKLSIPFAPPNRTCKQVGSDEEGKN